MRALLARMTLDEKIGQLTMVTGSGTATGPQTAPVSLAEIRVGRAGSILNLWTPAAVREVQRIAVEESRLGIPLIVGFDVLHGHRTIFPVPLGEAASFDTALWEETAAAAAEEAASDGVSLTFAPMLDVTRDPRWGRICESPGEDAHVAARFAEAKVKGFQGSALASSRHVAATAKHLGAYGAVLAGRDYASADVSQRELEEVHLPAFASAVKAGVAAVMPSFIDIAGTPATASRPLLRGILRDRWNFQGVVISDYNAIAELITHGVAADLAEAATLALRAGVDIDMMAGAYSRGLPVALDRGLVAMADIDTAVLRVLTLKDDLGLFADPYRGLITASYSNGPRYRRLAKRAAASSMVLLKNSPAVLPLSQHGGPIAVVGPLAHAPADMLGPWAAAGRAEEGVSFLDGMRAAFPGRRILHQPAAGFDPATLVPALAREAGIVIFCAGETRNMSGEASSRGEPGLPMAQIQLAKNLLAANNPLVLVLCSGRPLILPPFLAEGAAAILAAWFPGSEAGTALGDVLSGGVEPGGRLPVSWPASIGQIPIYYSERRTGRPANSASHYSSKYLDIPAEPHFPFGHGLSYTAFRFDNLRTGRPVMAAGETLEVAVDASNIGDRNGGTIVMLFIQHQVASVARPVMELKRFQRIEAAPQEKLTVTFRLGSNDLQFPGADLEPVLENGRIDILVGQRAVESELLRAGIELTGGQNRLPAGSR